MTKIINQLHITRFTANYLTTGQVFKLRYDAMSGFPGTTHRQGKCGGIFSTLNGIFTSPSYPDYYPQDIDCIYKISTQTGKVILLTFPSLDVWCKTTFRWISSFVTTKIRLDYLEIRDGPRGASPLLRDLLCDSEIPSPIQSTQEHLWIRYVKNCD